MSKKNRRWKDKSNDDLRKLYEDKFNDMNRGELREADPKFYRILGERGMLMMVPSNKRLWSTMSDDALGQYYEANYNGLGVTDLQKVDASFEQTLRKRGLTHILPRRQLNWKNVPNDELRKTYRTKYAGVTSAELQKRDNAFYNVLRKRGMLDEVEKLERHNWKDLTDEDLLEFLKNNFEGMGRTDVIKVLPTFYKILKERGLVHHLPTKNRNWQDISDEGLLQYYLDNHNGTTRSALYFADRRFYTALKKRKLLSLIDTKGRNWQDISDGDLIRYYKDNYSGMTRAKLQRADGSFYTVLTKRNLVCMIPRARHLRINTPEKLAGILDTDDKARYAIQLAHGDDVDFADVIAILYEGRISRESVLAFTQEPSIRNYLGRFRKPAGIADIMEPAEDLLQFDRNDVLRRIIYKRLLQYRQEYLGTNPSPEQRTAFMDDLRRQMNKLGGNAV